MMKKRADYKQTEHAYFKHVVIPEIWELFWRLFVRNGAADRLNDLKKL